MTGTNVYPRYHPVSHENITGTSCLLNAQLTSSPTVTSERKLRWEIQEPSELGEAYSRWLPFSVRKRSSINTFTAFLSFNTMPQGLSSVKRKVRILWYCFFHFLLGFPDVLNQVLLQFAPVLKIILLKHLEFGVILWFH